MVQSSFNINESKLKNLFRHKMLALLFRHEANDDKEAML